jgi:hypothetical protein
VHTLGQGQGVVKLVVVLGLIAAFIAVAQRVSPALPGIAGSLYRQNVDKNIEATALIYSEPYDIRRYLGANAVD